VDANTKSLNARSGTTQAKPPALHSGRADRRQYVPFFKARPHQSHGGRDVARREELARIHLGKAGVEYAGEVAPRIIDLLEKCIELVERRSPGSMKLVEPSRSLAREELFALSHCGINCLGRSSLSRSLL
jgi:hypothetical protein